LTKHVAPLGYIILIPSQTGFAFTSYYSINACLTAYTTTLWSFLDRIGTRSTTLMASTLTMLP